MFLPITDNTLALQALVPRHFRDLPKEVRNRIYYFSFEHPAGVGNRTYAKRQHNADLSKLVHSTLANIHAVDKDLHREAV